ncbi:hypothetical protein KI387_042214, partial [Taxus chinensis]
VKIERDQLAIERIKWTTEWTQANTNIARLTGAHDALQQASIIVGIEDILVDLMTTIGEEYYYKDLYHEVIPEGHKATPFSKLAISRSRSK